LGPTLPDTVVTVMLETETPLETPDAGISEALGAPEKAAGTVETLEPLAPRAPLETVGMSSMVERIVTGPTEPVFVAMGLPPGPTVIVMV